MAVLMAVPMAVPTVGVWAALMAVPMGDCLADQRVQQKADCWAAPMGDY